MDGDFLEHSVEVRIKLSKENPMSTVEEIVEAIKELPREKQAEVWRRLYQLWWTSEPDLASGVNVVGDESLQLIQRFHWLTSNKYGSPRKRSQGRRPPIKIKGKPISET